MSNPSPVILDPTYHTEERILAFRPTDDRIRSREECRRVEIRIVWDETLDVIVVASESTGAYPEQSKEERFAELRTIAKRLAETLVNGASK